MSLCSVRQHLFLSRFFLMYIDGSWDWKFFCNQVWVAICAFGDFIQDSLRSLICSLNFPDQFSRRFMQAKLCFVRCDDKKIDAVSCESTEHAATTLFCSQFVWTEYIFVILWSKIYVMI